MLFTALGELLREEQIQVADERLHPLGNQGEIALFPEKEEEIAAILQYANNHDLKVIPMGGGTKRGFGGLMEKADILLCLSSYKGIVDYSEGDMTITAKAGTTMREIAEFLKVNRQMLPLHPSWPDQATIGGVVAANDSGPKRLRYGSARDLVIGMRVIYPDGQVIRTGGKVVKNVAGYDMNKLFVGSMGTLGILSEINLKLRPMPKLQSLVLLRFLHGKEEHIRPFAIRLLDSFMEPVSLELLNPSLHARLSGDSGYALAIAFENVPNAVRVQEEWVRVNRPPGAEISVLSGGEAEAWWESFAKIAPNGATEDSLDVVGLKIGSKNLEAIDIVCYCEELANRYGIYVESHGGAGHGLSRAFIRGGREKSIPFIQDLRSFVQAMGGYVVVQHAALSLRKEIEVWGEKPAYFPLLVGIKRAIDPRRTLNATRFVGGI